MAYRAKDQNGWVVVEHRVPRPGDYWLTRSNKPYVVTGSCSHSEKRDIVIKQFPVGAVLRAEHPEKFVPIGHRPNSIGTYET